MQQKDSLRGWTCHTVSGDRTAKVPDPVNRWDVDMPHSADVFGAIVVVMEEVSAENCAWSFCDGGRSENRISTGALRFEDVSVSPGWVHERALHHCTIAITVLHDFREGCGWGLVVRGVRHRVEFIEVRYRKAKHQSNTRFNDGKTTASNFISFWQRHVKYNVTNYNVLSPWPTISIIKSLSIFLFLPGTRPQRYNELAAPLLETRPLPNVPLSLIPNLGASFEETMKPTHILPLPLPLPHPLAILLHLLVLFSYLPFTLTFVAALLSQLLLLLFWFVSKASHTSWNE